MREEQRRGTLSLSGSLVKTGKCLHGDDPARGRADSSRILGQHRSNTRGVRPDAGGNETGGGCAEVAERVVDAGGSLQLRKRSARGELANFCRKDDSLEKLVV